MVLYILLDLYTYIHDSNDALIYAEWQHCSLLILSLFILFLSLLSSLMYSNFGLGSFCFSFYFLFSFIFQPFHLSSNSDTITRANDSIIRANDSTTSANDSTIRANDSTTRANDVTTTAK